MNIACYLATKDRLEKALLPEDLLLELSKALTVDGREVVHYQDRSIDVEGVYIPAKGTETSIMLIPSIED